MANGLGRKTLASRKEQLMDSDRLHARKLFAEVEERELRVLVRKGRHVPIDSVRERCFFQIVQANYLLRNKLENYLPPQLVGRDEVDIRNEMARVVYKYIAIMNSGDKKKIPKLPETCGRQNLINSKLDEILQTGHVITDRRPPWQWCEEHIEAIPYSPVPEGFRSANSPWIREPLEALTDPAVSLISIIAVIQAGKTKTAELGSC
jgi:hypothetical protein